LFAPVNSSDGIANACGCTGNCAGTGCGSTVMKC
jgi:hypothetical protein